MNYRTIIPLVMLTCFSVSAIADFKYKGPKKVVFNNKAEFDLEEIPVDAYGESVPLEFAIDILIGEQLKAKFGVGVNQNALIDWRGGRSRGEILTEILTPLELSYGYNAGTITIRTNREIAVANSLGVEFVGGVPQEPVIWEIIAPTTVKTIFEKWTEQAGKEFDWALPEEADCSIGISHTMTGTFDHVVEQIVYLSNQQGDCRIPYGKVTGNGVLVIDNEYGG